MVQSNVRPFTPYPTHERHKTPSPRLPKQPQEPQRVAQPRQPSALEIASQRMAARSRPPGPPPRDTPQAAASPSKQQETPPSEHGPLLVASANGSRQTGAAHPTPVPAGRGWSGDKSHVGASPGPVAAEMGWIGTGEGPGCTPTDERAQQVQSILKRVLMAAKPYLGPNRIDTTRCVPLSLGIWEPLNPESCRRHQVFPLLLPSGHNLEYAFISLGASWRVGKRLPGEGNLGCKP